VASFLKVFAASRGITQGEALNEIVGIIERYGDMAAITANGLKDFTTAVEARLDAQDLKVARILEEIAVIARVLQIAAGEEIEDREYEATNDDFEDYGNHGEVDEISRTRIKTAR
jgi:hypothetical protein